MPSHDQVEISLGKRSALVDVGMATLLKEVWRAGCETKLSCQERPDGRAFVTFFEAAHAQRFLSIAAGAFSNEPESLYNRIVRFWYLVPEDSLGDPKECGRAARRFARQRFWSYHVEPWNERVQWTESGDHMYVADVEPVVQFQTTIAFPPSDIEELTRRFRRANMRPEVQDVD